MRSARCCPSITPTGIRLRSRLRGAMVTMTPHLISGDLRRFRVRFGR